jgi:hypothetical protein
VLNLIHQPISAEPLARCAYFLYLLEKPGKNRPVPNLQLCLMGSCLFGAESPLRLLACRGRTASLLRQVRYLRSLAGTHQLSAIPQAPEPLRFDSWPRHWSNGLKPGQNHILSYPMIKLGFAKPLTKAKSPPATAMDGLVFGEPQDAAFYRTTYTRFLKSFIFYTLLPV